MPIYIKMVYEKEKKLKKLKPGRARPDFLVPGGPGGLGPTQGQFLAPKFKIYVKIMYCEHFLNFEIFWLLVSFETLFTIEGYILQTFHILQNFKSYHKNICSERFCINLLLLPVLK